MRTVRGMNSSHFCLAFRRKLSNALLRKAVQWRPYGNRASFISLRNTPPAAREKSNRGLSDLGIGSSGQNKTIPKSLLERRQPIRPTPVVSAGDQLESLLDDTIKNQQPATTEPAISTSSLHIYENADILKGLIADKSSSAEDCWQFFIQHFGPSPWKKGFIDGISSPSYLYTRNGGYVGRDLMMNVVSAKDRDPMSATLPSYTRISQTYLELGILHGTDWADMMLGLIRNVLKHKDDTSLNPADEQALILDLLGSWNLVFRKLGTSQYNLTSPSATLDWSNVPAVTLGDVKRAYATRQVRAFGLLAPNLPTKQLAGLPLVAAATFAIVMIEPKISQSTIQDASPLVSSIARLLAHPSLKSSQLAHPDTTNAKVILNFVQTNWPQINKQASQNSGLPTKQGVTDRRLGGASNYIYKRLQDALKRKDVSSVDTIWSEVMKYPVHKDDDPNGQDARSSPQGTLTAGVCDYLIMVYMALRRPNSAIDVWNQMVNIGFPPSLSTWNHMLLGCLQCRDPVAMEEIWARMQALHIQPDAVCWTTRINGLIECGKAEESIRVLDEMGRLWLAAARLKYGNKTIEAFQDMGDFEDAVKPTIANINAAVAGLFRKQNSEAANRILVWAGQFGIRPNIITYNILLRPLVRNGHMKEVLSLLQKMQQDDIEADVVTFTTILEETLRYSDGFSVKEQEETIANVFSEMEAAGVKPNVQTYNRIIHQLLLSNNTDLTSVNAVTARMAREGLQVGPHVHTMLVEYHFSRAPPNIHAVQSLVERAREDPASVDHIFWSRVIEGYASVGYTASAIKNLARVTELGTTIGWRTLDRVLTALVQNVEWDNARSLVRYAHLHYGGPLAADVKGQDGQHQFWKLAQQLELVDSSFKPVVK